MLTARGEESERVRGLATGADDYIVEPFSMRDLLARVNGRCARQPHGPPCGSPTATSCSIARNAASRGRGARSTSARRIPALDFLLEHPGRVFSREQLLDSVWGRTIYIDGAP